MPCINRCNESDSIIKPEADALPLVSLIIPVYDVEPYLRKCLDSVLNQTYQNFEAILIDDGSHDGCGEICDSYAMQDARIKTIHQPCMGLSAARNAGLEEARGEFVFFLDSDDSVDVDFFSSAMEAALRLKADIVCFGYRVVNQKGRIKKTFGFAHEDVISSKQAILLLLHGKLSTDVWVKVFRRELFEGIRFPVGRLSETRVITPQLFCKSQNIALLPLVTYNHLFPREGSICTEKTKEYTEDIRVLEIEKNRFIMQAYPELAAEVREAELAVQLILSSRELCFEYWRDKQKQDELARFILERKGALKCRLLSLKHRAWFLLFLILPKCAIGLYRMNARTQLNQSKHKAPGC